MSDRESMGDVDDRKQKRKMEEEPPNSDEELEDLLTLRLGSSSSSKVDQSSSKSTPKTLKISEESGSSTKPVGEKVEGKEYPCQYCDKKFPSSQALGGHQNAHKAQRSIIRSEKKEVNNMDTAFGYGSNSNLYYNPYPYSMPSMPNLGPFQGSSPFYRGANMHMHPPMSNLHPPMGNLPNNILPSWHQGSAAGAGAAAGGYGYGNQFGLHVPHTPPTPPQYGINSYWGGAGSSGASAANTPPTAPQFGVNNFWGGAGSSGGAANTPPTAAPQYGMSNYWGGAGSSGVADRPPTVPQFGGLLNNYWGGASSSGAAIPERSNLLNLGPFAHQLNQTPPPTAQGAAGTSYNAASHSRAPIGGLQVNNNPNDGSPRESTSGSEELDLSLNL